MLIPLALAAFCVNGGTALAQGERTLEMVSPPSKNNASILSAMAIDSNHVALASSGSLLESDPFYVGAGQYVAARTEHIGWTPAFSPVEPNSFLADHFGGDDRIFESFAPLLPGEPNEGGTDVYRWTAGQLSMVSTGSVGGQGAFEASYLTSSAGGGHVLFKTAEQLDPRDGGRTPGASMLYEHVGDQTRAVGLGSDGAPLGSGGAILAGDGPGALTPVGEGGVSHPISDDGSRIFFESPDPVVGGDTQLYVREEGQTTTLVSAPQRSSPGDGAFPARFEGAAADGSRVVFRSRAQLVDGDDDTYVDLYGYDLGTGQLTRLSAGQQGAEAGQCPADGANGLHGVCGVVALAEDGRRVYYLSTGALAPGGVAGRLNLYLHDAHDGQTHTVASVANDLDGTIDWTVNGLYQAGLDRAIPRAEATPDGSVLAFVADTSLTSFDSAGPDCPSDTQGRCVQVYLYDASTHAIECVSCNGAGLSPRGSADVPVTAAAPRPVRRFLSPDGTRVAFETPDALLPADDNGVVDVYEWSNGAVALVSSGTSTRRSTLVGYGPDAKDLFFLTAEPLLAQDTDVLTDLYDARIGGGLPGPPNQSPACHEDACQPRTAAPPLRAGGTGAPRENDNASPPRPGRVELLRIAPLGRDAVRRLRVTVRATQAGRLSIAASVRSSRRQLIVGRTSERVRRGRTLTVDVPVRSKVLQKLRRARSLRLLVTARLSSAPRWDREAVTLAKRAGR